MSRTVALAPFQCRKHGAVVIIDGLRWRVARMIDRYRAVIVRVAPPVVESTPSPVAVCIARFEQKPTLTRLILIFISSVNQHRKTSP